MPSSTWAKDLKFSWSYDASKMSQQFLCLYVYKNTSRWIKCWRKVDIIMWGISNCPDWRDWAQCFNLSPLRCFDSLFTHWILNDSMNIEIRIYVIKQRIRSLFSWHQLHEATLEDVPGRSIWCTVHFQTAAVSPGQTQMYGQLHSYQSKVILCSSLYKFSLSFFSRPWCCLSK